MAVRVITPEGKKVLVQRKGKYYFIPYHPRPAHLKKYKELFKKAVGECLEEVPEKEVFGKGLKGDVWKASGFNECIGKKMRQWSEAMA